MHGLRSWWSGLDISGRIRNPVRIRKRGRLKRKLPPLQVELLESRTLLATFSLPSGSRAPAGQDYFAIEQNNPLDYVEPSSTTAGNDDRRNAGLDDAGITNASLGGGQYNFTTTTATQIFLLDPGVSDSELAGTNRHAGTVPEPTSGESIPIDTSKYYRLNMKITLDGPAQTIGNIQWYDGRAVPTTTATRGFFVFPGTNIYSFDLRNISLNKTASGPWTGNMSGLFVYPANVPGKSIHLDWVTLTGNNQASLPVSLTGAAGNAEIGLSTDGNPANLIKFIRPTDNTDTAFLTQTNLLPPTSAASISSVDVTALGPGTYFLHALDASGGVVPGTTPQQILVNHIPTATVLQPDAVGDEATEYSATFRNDAWDFSQPSDFKVPPFIVSPGVFDNTAFGTAAVVTNPNTANFGQLPGTWMKYDNATATHAPFDTQFQLPNNGDINTSRYHNITIRGLLDRTRDLELGAVMRVMWSDQNPLLSESHLVQTDDIVVENGVQTVSLDLNTVQIEPNSTGKTLWANYPNIRYLRIDPSEYPDAVSAYFDQVLLTRNDFTTNGKFNITWNATDADGDPITLTNIKIDPDKNRGNGNEITIGTNVANSGAFLFDTAAVANLAAGSYYVLLTYSDGRNTAFRYSTGKLDVSPVGPAGTAVMQRSYNPNANFHFFTTSSAQFENAVNHGYRDEATAREGFAINTSQTGTSSPLFRLYNLQRGFHYYTLNPVEKNALLALNPPAGSPDFGKIGWRDEGAEGFMYATPQTGTAILYRLYNKDSGVHLFTINPSLKDAILAAFPLSWQQHSDVGYAFPVGIPSVATQQSVAAEMGALFGTGADGSTGNNAADMAAVAIAIGTSGDETSGVTSTSTAGTITPAIAPTQSNVQTTTASSAGESEDENDASVPGNSGSSSSDSATGTDVTALDAALTSWLNSDL